MAPSKMIEYPIKYTNRGRGSTDDSFSGYQAFVSLLDTLSNVADLVHRCRKSRTGISIDKKQEHKFSDTIVHNANSLTRDFKNAVEDARKNGKFDALHTDSYRKCHVPHHCMSTSVNIVPAL
jgi:hypothetical protein